MSLQVRWTEGSNGPLQVNSLDLKNPKKAKVNRNPTGTTREGQCLGNNAAHQHDEHAIV